MANPDTNLLLINQLRSEYDQLKLDYDTLIGNSVSIDSMSAAQKREVIENIFPNGVAIDVNDPNIKAGDKVFGEKVGINGGKWFFGNVITAPPTQDSHIDFKYEEI